MHVERAVTFNQQVITTVAGEVGFDWKPGPVDKLDLNPFVPITLQNMNLKTLSWYEVLGNSIELLHEEDDVVHATKVEPAVMPPENHFAGEMGAFSGSNQHSFKY